MLKSTRNNHIDFSGGSAASTNTSFVQLVQFESRGAANTLSTCCESCTFNKIRVESCSLLEVRLSFAKQLSEQTSGQRHSPDELVARKIRT